MGKNSQKRAAAREAEKLAKRAQLESEFGITIRTSKPVIGGRYGGIRVASTIRYPRTGTGTTPKAMRRG